MSCPNFPTSYNTRNIYAFDMYCDYDKYVESYEPDDDEEPESHESWSDFSYYDHLEDIAYRLKEAFGDYAVSFPNRRDSYRREGRIIATIQKSILFAGYYRTVSVDVVAIGGYWDGWMADVMLNRANDFDWLPDADDLEYELTHDLDDNVGLARMLAPKLSKRLEATYNDLLYPIDEILAGCCDHKLGCTGIFSNGEATYAEVA